jgi:hypothetical protein
MTSCHLLGICVNFFRRPAFLTLLEAKVIVRMTGEYVSVRFQVFLNRFSAVSLPYRPVLTTSTFCPSLFCDRLCYCFFVTLVYRAPWYSDNDVGLHSGNAWFESWQGHISVLTEIFRGFTQFLQASTGF